MPDADSPRVNVADRLAAVAAERPDALAVVAYDGGRHNDPYILAQQNTDDCIVAFDTACGINYTAVTLGFLDRQADLLARGLVAMGVRPGTRIALLVKPGIEFVTLVFALLRSGATMVLVDAGLGRENLVRCLASTEPEGFVAIPLGHAMRVLKRGWFPNAKLNVTVGRRWFWGGETLQSLRKRGEQSSPPPGGEARLQTTGGEGGRTRVPAASPLPNPPHQGEGVMLPHTAADNPAAIVFTSGSTGPPKGVLYTHETFVTQCDEIQRRYDIRPGAVDLACFPLFGLFNIACGVTTVLPDMDFSRPASCDPKKVLAAANQWKATQAFASPAVWDRLSTHCEKTGESIPTLKKVFSCGAPVPAKVLRRTLKCVHPDAEMHTPYGATEALPVATIEAKEILEETAAKTDEGAGVCVGRKFDTVDWRIIQISDDPIATIDETEEMPTGEIGELIVRGPQVSKRYLTSEPTTSAVGANHNALAKIQDGESVWHRMGDVGYFDEEGRFWYCGRKSQRVVTSGGTLYPVCVEAVFNSKATIHQAAFVGVGERGSEQLVLICIPAIRRVLGPPGHPTPEQATVNSLTEVFQENYAQMTPKMHLLFRAELPTDIRHNSKIRREELSAWAGKQLKERRRVSYATALTRANRR